MNKAKSRFSVVKRLDNGLPCLQELDFPLLEKGANTLTVAAAGDATCSELIIQAENRWRQGDL